MSDCGGYRRSANGLPLIPRSAVIPRLAVRITRHVAVQRASGSCGKKRVAVPYRFSTIRVECPLAFLNTMSRSVITEFSSSPCL